MSKSIVFDRIRNDLWIKTPSRTILLQRNGRVWELSKQQKTLLVGKSAAHWRKLALKAGAKLTFDMRNGEKWTFSNFEYLMPE